MPESALAQMVRCGKDIKLSSGWFFLFFSHVIFQFSLLFFFFRLNYVVVNELHMAFFFLFNRYVSHPILYSRRVDLRGEVGNCPTRDGHEPERAYRNGGHEKLL